MKRKNEMADLEKITREDYALNWSQSKVCPVVKYLLTSGNPSNKRHDV